MKPFTDAQKAEVIEGALTSIRTGQSLRSFCIANDLPYATVWNWINPDGITDNSPYARAREIGTHYLAEECLEIADDSSHDVKLLGDGDHEVCNTEFVQRAKLRIDTRLRLIGKWNRKDYGDKTSLEHSGPNGAPIQTQEVSPRELLAGKLNRLSAGIAAPGDAGKPE